MEPTVALKELPQGAAPDFERRYARNGPAHLTVRRLHAALRRLESAGTLEEASAGLEALVGWLLDPRKEHNLTEHDGVNEDSRTRRLRLLVWVLQKETELAAALRRAVQRMLEAPAAMGLLVSTALPASPSFFAELSARTAVAILPQPQDPGDLCALLVRGFRGQAAVEWLDQVPSQPAQALLSLGMDPPGGEALQRLRRRAVVHLATRICAMAMAEDVLLRSGGEDGPFLELVRLAHVDPVSLESGQARFALAACRQVLAKVLSHVEEYGVSTDLVFRLECISQGLGRIEDLCGVTSAPIGEARIRRALAALTSMLQDAFRARSVLDVVRSNSRQLARKIAERTGQHGGHYVTRTRREWWGMLASAGGGGALTAGTTALKFHLAWMSLPIFFAGLFQSFNYAGSFLLMQLLGFTLATKQPSMTAAALAAELRPAGKTRDFAALVDMVARITRSQLAAVLGNLGVVIPVCAAFHAGYQALRGQPFLDAKTAQYVVQSLHPLESATIPFAALTGIFLWFSSLAAGWLENWVAYRRIPEAIAQQRGLGRLFGRRGAAWLASRLTSGAAGIGGNVTLGMLLGMTPAFARFFGLGLDVRHVTLSTGALTLAFGALGPEAFVALGGKAAVAGIGIIGLLNFGVSFLCALLVALRAREVGVNEDVRLAGALFRGFLTRPLRFFFPPATPAGEKETAGVAGH